MAETKQVTQKSVILVPSSTASCAVEGGCGLVVELFGLERALGSTLPEIQRMIAAITAHQVRLCACVRSRASQLLFIRG